MFTLISLTLNEGGVKSANSLVGIEFLNPWLRTLKFRLVFCPACVTGRKHALDSLKSDC